MTYKRITVPLDQETWSELQRIAQHELRNPREQASYLLRTILLQSAPIENGAGESSR